QLRLFYRRNDVELKTKVVAALALLLLSGCAATSVTPIYSDNFTCYPAEYRDFWVTSVVTPCYSIDNKLIGFGNSQGESPAGLLGGAAQAAIFSAGIPIALGALEGSNTNETVNGGGPVR